MTASSPVPEPQVPSSTKVAGALVPAPAEPFDMASYISDVANDRALDAQQQLVIAYDRAVRQLIGPNDVQSEGGREFKKKSAWRKLARYFRISTQLIGEASHRDADGHLIATVIVRASAPWGQYAEALAKCSTRESRFSSEKSKLKADHDCAATAQTRATNRAVADLIAAGEVSAEEMEFGESGAPAAPTRSAKPRTEQGRPEDPALKAMPFGKDKGKPLGEIGTSNLITTVDWCRARDKENATAGKALKFTKLIESCTAVIASRGRPSVRGNGYEAGESAAGQGQAGECEHGVSLDQECVECTAEAEA